MTLSDSSTLESLTVTVDTIGSDATGDMITGIDFAANATAYVNNVTVTCKDDNDTTFQLLNIGNSGVTAYVRNSWINATPLSSVKPNWDQIFVDSNATLYLDDCLVEGRGDNLTTYNSNAIIYADNCEFLVIATASKQIWTRNIHLGNNGGEIYIANSRIRMEAWNVDSSTPIYCVNVENRRTSGGVIRLTNCDLYSVTVNTVASSFDSYNCRNGDGTADDGILDLYNCRVYTYRTGTNLNTDDRAVGLAIDGNGASSTIENCSFYTEETNRGDAFSVDVTGNGSVVARNSSFSTTAANDTFYDLKESGSSGSITVDNVIYDRNKVLGNIIDRDDMRYMKNTSGGQLVAGDVVAATNEISNVTSNEFEAAGDKDNLVIGMLTETVADDAFGWVQIMGSTAVLKADGTDTNGGGNIAVGDLLTAYSYSNRARKAAAGEMAFAIAMEAFTTEHTVGTLDAVLIEPRQMND